MMGQLLFRTLMRLDFLVASFGVGTVIPRVARDLRDFDLQTRRE